jgi:hypothetical protein
MITGNEGGIKVSANAVAPTLENLTPIASEVKIATPIDMSKGADF